MYACTCTYVRVRVGACKKREMRSECLLFVNGLAAFWYLEAILGRVQDLLNLSEGVVVLALRFEPFERLLDQDLDIAQLHACK
jgi:hypothetical protein